VADIRLQALRYCVSIVAEDNTECIERALALGLKPKHLYAWRSRALSPTPESNLCQAALEHFNATGDIPTLVIVKDWVLKGAARSGVSEAAVEATLGVLEALPLLRQVPSEVSTVVQTLIDDYRRNKLTEELTAVADGLVRSVPISELTQRLHSIADGVDDVGTDNDGVHSVADSWKERWEQYVAVEQNPRQARGVMLGWLAYDRLSNGVRPGELLVVAGNSSVGKSAFQLRSALNAWKLDNRNVMVVNKEMSNRVQHQRMEAMELSELMGEQVSVERLMAGIEMGKLDSASRDAYYRLLESYADRTNQFWFVSPDAYDTLGDLESIVGRYKRRFGLDLLCADSLNLQRAPGTRGMVGEELVGAGAQFLKDMAARHNIAIITDCQSPKACASKEVVSKEDAVGYSQRIIHAADDIIRLYPREGPWLDAQVLKCRSAQSDYTFTLYFEPSSMRLEYSNGPESAGEL